MHDVPKHSTRVVEDEYWPFFDYYFCFDKKNSVVGEKNETTFKIPALRLCFVFVCFWAQNEEQP